MLVETLLSIQISGKIHFNNLLVHMFYGWMWYGDGLLLSLFTMAPVDHHVVEF